MARDAGSAIVDLSYALEDEPTPHVRSPWIERQLGQTPASELQPGPVRGGASGCGGAGAAVAARAEGRQQSKRVVATVFEPASEHGQKGMDELHEQTVNLLSFQQLPKKVFDTQVAFNMVARYGEHQSPALAIGRAPRAQALRADRRQGCAAAVAAAAAGADLPRARFRHHLEMEKPVELEAIFAGAGRGACDHHGRRRIRPAT